MPPGYVFACVGQCSIVDLDLFPLTDDGFSGVGPGTQVPAGEEQTAAAVVSACPVRALSLRAGR
jgi:ferredoxin